MSAAFKVLLVVVVVAMMVGCATPRPDYDYTAFKASHPASILVLPPINDTPDVGASDGLLSLMTLPLAESGYYVFPVALVSETFRQNGMTTPHDIHAIPFAKLREIFGADAALYVTVTRYGAEYHLLSSAAAVAAHAKLVDLKTGQTLWAGSAAATNDENNNSGGGLVGMLVSAAVKQVMNNVTDASYKVADVTSRRLLFAGRLNGMLFGPRSPYYNKPVAQ